MSNQRFRLLFPTGYTGPAAPLPDDSFLKTLQIDRMVALRRESFRGLLDLKLEKFFSSDEAVLAYRADVVNDLMETPALFGLIDDALPLMRDLYEMRKVLGGVDATLESSLNCTRCLEMYLEIMELFYTRLADAAPKSEGLQRLKAEINARWNSPEDTHLRGHLSKVQYRIGHVKSIAVGINLDGTLKAAEAGLLAVNTQPYRMGSLMDKLLGRQGSDPMVCISGFANISKTSRDSEKAAINSAALWALDSIFARTVKSWAPVIDQYYTDQARFFVDLLDDFRFLSAAIHFLQELKAAGCPLCRPVIRPMAEKALRLKNVCNPMLALKGLGETLVCNDFACDEQGRFFLITGPNHGGKSIFCYAVGMAQALFQLGLLVPAEAAELSPVRCIFTHFPTSDEDNYGKGRLESECARMSAVLHRLTEYDLLLMDESFSSTSLLEGSYIAGEVISAVNVIGCSGLFVTHIHELTQKPAQFNAVPGRKGCVDNLVAQMENVADGTRSYRVLRTTPDGLSYAKDIAKKYGLSAEEILAGR